ncbi:N-acetylmuramoyl-L-alanine amidase [Stenotrophomonas sp. SY1]|uniref:peptidoglycan recognition protein family protein n=1 Tax=Stenotrophomonas sp. SY1 TaxID=477235 RepID=UPI001E47731E|nr:N-acetylmuramoyl-L-alanine amidase [Stenotrophomonas sp. SY1]MCD9088150.1 N-acetylmuramoyl-L-alanine amidase [Stenotrophomonas sp. SY1]
MHKSFHVGRGYSSPAAERQPVRLRVPVYIDDSGYVQNAGFMFKPIEKLEGGPLRGPIAIVMHRTAGSTVESALAAYRSSGYGTHFTIDKDGAIYQTASLKQFTRHVGTIAPRCIREGTCVGDEERKLNLLSYKGKHDHEIRKTYPARYPINEDSIGIEVVARHIPQEARWDPATGHQQESVSRLIAVLFKEFNITSSDTYEHDKISYKTLGEGAGLYGGIDSLPVTLPEPII